MVPFPENGDSGKELVGGIEGLRVNCGFSLKQSLSNFGEYQVYLES